MDLLNDISIKSIWLVYPFKQQCKCLLGYLERIKLCLPNGTQDVVIVLYFSLNRPQYWVQSKKLCKSNPDNLMSFEKKCSKQQLFGGHLKDSILNFSERPDISWKYLSDKMLAQVSSSIYTSKNLYYSTFPVIFSGARNHILTAL